MNTFNIWVLVLFAFAIWAKAKYDYEYLSDRLAHRNKVSYEEGIRLIVKALFAQIMKTLLLLLFAFAFLVSVS